MADPAGPPGLTTSAPPVLGPALVDFAGRTAAAMGLAWAPDDAQFREGHEPLSAPVDLAERCEPAALALFDARSIDAGARPYHLIAAALELLRRGGDLLDQRIGSEMIVWSLVVGSKTVPRPLPSAAD